MMFDDEMPAAPEIIVRDRRGGNQVSDFWTTEKFNTAKKLFLDEGRSYTKVAEALGCTRNMVCGALTRAGVFRSTPTERKERIKRRDAIVDAHKIKKIIKRRAATLPIGEEITDLPCDVPDNAVTLMQLERHHCRWPCFHCGPEQIYCGGNAVDSLSYCARHCRIAYVPPKRRAPAKYWNRNGAAA